MMMIMAKSSIIGSSHSNRAPTEVGTVYGPQFVHRLYLSYDKRAF